MANLDDYPDVDDVVEYIGQDDAPNGPLAGALGIVIAIDTTGDPPMVYVQWERAPTGGFTQEEIKAGR